MLWETIGIIIAALLLLEGMLILTIPKQTTKLIKMMIKKEKQFKFVGMIEALIGLILLILVLVY
ncbi:MAG: DUF2065 family protein [Nanoarchaeota archaeon]|nr:DUF2065 family protein [Nanoarchaeota archaeon]MBU1051918.1 DUF2065 family protein [Nanoarchaeota archaeon]MBU1988728.1 DUF2065 family protein [Nanoarchaeota archaeon]